MSKIEHVNEIIIREPSYSYNKFLEIPDTDAAVNEFVLLLFTDDFFKQALFLASPQLYYQWKKSIEETNWEEDKRNHLNRSIIKYYIRISTRCTPFGLFSNYSSISPSADTLKDQEIKESIETYASIDLLYLYAVVNAINKNHVLRSTQKYAPNNSLYKIGGDYRYVEVSYRNTKRFHGLTSLESDEIIELLFSITNKEAKTIEELSNILIDSIEDVTYDDVLSYVHALIDSQILIGDLDIRLNESSPIIQIVSYLEKNLISVKKDEYLMKVYTSLKKLNEKIEMLNNKSTKKSIAFYKEIFDIADELDITYEKQYLININLRKNHESQHQKCLTSADYELIKKAIETLSRFSTHKAKEDSRLSKFKEAFYKKYEEQEVPLLVALDNELGIDYKGNSEHFNAFSKLIDDIQWEGEANYIEEIKLDHKQHTFWNTLFHNAYIGGKKEIDLSTVDISSFPSSIDQLPTSFSVLASKVNTKILIHSAGDNALDMIGRFTNLDKKLDTLVTDVVTKEKKYNKGCIQAEFIHLPNDRDANILTRNINRDIEIPFLTRQSENTDVILLSDIYVSLRNNQFVLRSKSHDKVVDIYNTNAHNYKYDSLPVYEFICDVHFDNTIKGLGLNIGSANVNSFKFFPRVTYGKDIIMSPATWKFNLTDLEPIIDTKTNCFVFKKFRQFTEKYEIPKYVYLAEGDNQLLIDTENEFLIQFIYEVVKKKEKIVIIEVLEDIQGRDTRYANEYIIPFINPIEKTHSRYNSAKVKNDNVQRKFMPGDQWLYYKVYIGIKSADIIISKVLNPLIKELKEQGLIEKWFFIRYNDPEFHLRVRFKYSQKVPGAIDKVAIIFNRYIKPYMDNHCIDKVELSTYTRELERYGGELIDEAETIFYHDSDMAIRLIQTLRENNQEEKRWILCLKAIDGFFEIFNVSSKEKLEISKGLFDAFQKEFKASKNMRKQIDKKFRDHKADIIKVMNTEIDEYLWSITERNEMIKGDVEKLWNIEKSFLKYLLNSFIHMTVNRIAISNPRMHELVVYGFLEKFYRIEVYQKSKPEIIC